MIIGIIFGAIAMYAWSRHNEAKRTSAHLDLTLEAATRGMGVLDIIEERNNAHIAKCQARLAEIEAATARRNERAHKIKWF